MLRHRIRTLLACLLFVAWCNPARAAEMWTFDVIPSGGYVNGPAGTTVGWGYKVENLSDSLWLVPTIVSADVFANGTDLSLFDFPIVPPTTFGPLSTVTENFVPDVLGLWQQTWDVGAPNGFIDSGNFVMSAEFWTDNPLNEGATLVPDSASSLSQAYTAQVTNPAEIPEPATLTLLGLGLLGGCVARKRLQTRRAL